MGQYADHVQITALCKALDLNVSIAYLYDGDTQEKPFVHTFPKQDDPACIHLLYNSIHYDVLYSNHNNSCFTFRVITIM